jgi:hypothetical protein
VTKKKGFGSFDIRGSHSYLKPTRNVNRKFWLENTLLMLLTILSLMLLSYHDSIGK